MTHKLKNIHIIPTDKPSRLILQGSELVLSKYLEINEGVSEFNQNIYITSDEEIKEGDWYLTFTNNEVMGQPRKCEDTNWNFSHCKKIILTTDQDLISNSIQAIDDKFLEWFVKNPSCESVEIEKTVRCTNCGQEYCDNLQCRGFKDIPYYKIIIPQEKPKQERICNCGLKESEHNVRHPFIPRQETLEEAAERLFPSKMSDYEIFLLGAKWQEERMYSEKEVESLLHKFMQSQHPDWHGYSTTKWFEQHKKK